MKRMLALFCAGLIVAMTGCSSAPEPPFKQPQEETVYYAYLIDCRDGVQPEPMDVQFHRLADGTQFPNSNEDFYLFDPRTKSLDQDHTPPAIEDTGNNSTIVGRDVAITQRVGSNSTVAANGCVVVNGTVETGATLVALSDKVVATQGENIAQGVTLCSEVGVIEIDGVNYDSSESGDSYVAVRKNAKNEFERFKTEFGTCSELLSHKARIALTKAPSSHRHVSVE